MLPQVRKESKNLQDTIKGKFNEYLERAEELHKIVAEQKNATDQATESGNPEAMKAHPGSGGASTSNVGGQSKEDSMEQLKMKQQLGGNSDRKTKRKVVRRSRIRPR